MQQALIVDDSKTARVVLHKMLDKHHILSAMVESAEEALEYLKDNRPDVIFMDHMMPGMDGFAAVKAIKADPGISSIPIVMHTTKQGDIYVGQARALGAIDILSKPASDEGLEAVLHSVQENALHSLPRIPVAEVTPISVGSDVDERPSEPEPAIPRFGRVNAELTRQQQQSSGSFFGSARQWVVAVIWLLPIIWLLYLYFPVKDQLQHQLQNQYREQRALIQALEWAVNQQESYDYGEAPMSGDRLRLLQGLVAKLRAADFTGIIRLEGHVGEFCLTQIPLEDGSDIVMLPKSELPVSACTMIGSSLAEAMKQSIAQSDAFREYIKSEGLMEPGSPIRVELVPQAASSPRYAYPSELEGISTGDWNAVALNNNRVHFVLLPD